MNTALIGHTGFVGSNLILQRQFEACYNSLNIESIVGENFDLVICAGAPAVKWLANQNPIQDWKNLQRLMNCLQQISAKKFILISTVDVYAKPVAVNEDTPIDTTHLHPYGYHRHELERFVQVRFDSLIVRLPGLFGNGLKKNIIYDFLHQHLLNKIHQDSVFQFYPLEYLWRDIQIALANQLSLINFATEPTSVAEVASEAFGFEFTQTPDIPITHYDMRSRYFRAFRGNEDGYLYHKVEILEKLKEFVAQQHKQGKMSH